MCYNISINSNKNKIEFQVNAIFENNFIFKPQKHISAFSNPLIPVITSENQSFIQKYYWGLIPKWVSSLNQANHIRKMTYNAKSETIKDKPSFKSSIKHQKCLIIADGFYEWQLTFKGKKCYFIEEPNNKIITFAGIWSNWLNQLTGELIKSVSIITQPANEMMAKIHNVKKRQPVIIHDYNRIHWLNTKLDYQNIINESFNINLKYSEINSPLKYH